MRKRALSVLFLIGAALAATTVARAQMPPPGDDGGEVPEAAQEPSRDKPIAAKPAASAKVAAVSPEVLKANTWTLGLASGLPEGNFMRFGAEIARNLNDGDRLRVMPILTSGATDNIWDLLYLKGVDVAFTNADVLEHFRANKAIPNIEARIQYIASMYVTHLHLLVRSDIGSLQDLEGKKVSFHTRGAGTSVSAPILFQRLGIKVEPVYVSNAIALEMMRRGELAGLVNSGGKPLDLFTKFENDAGYKFLAIPFDKFDDLYVPSVLTSEDYPGYIKPGEKIETLGIPVILAVYNWPAGTDRARRIQRFVDYLFDKFEGFQKPPYHPAWKSINLAAKVPGWVRYWATEEKLAKMGVLPAKPARLGAPASGRTPLPAGATGARPPEAR